MVTNGALHFERLIGIVGQIDIPFDIRVLPCSLPKTNNFIERKKTMALHTASTSVERISDEDPIPTLITFTFEITDGQLIAMTASDEQDRNYLVSIKLSNPDTDPQCCCPLPEGGFRCLKSAQCNC